MPPLFLIYTNNLSHDLSSNVKLFADDKSMFSIFHDQSNFINKLEADLENIRNCLHQWKVSFNPDASKRKLQTLLPQSTLITSYKSFIILHLDYASIICDQTINNFSHEKVESMK